MKIDSLQKLFQEELKDVYDAEKRLTKALPKMVKAARSEELKGAFRDHLEVTKGHVGRLEQVFQIIGVKASAKTCAGMKGLLEEGEEAIAQQGTDEMIDLGLIGAARRVEHYEMAAYLTLHDLAQGLDLVDAQELLAATLDEETEADESLAELAAELMMGSQDDSETDEGDILSEEDDEGNGVATQGASNSKGQKSAVSAASKQPAKSSGSSKKGAEL